MFPILVEAALISLQTLAPYVGVILTAGISGAINSIAGGGTFLTFPALTGFGHLSEKAANMTSTVGLWPGSAISILAAKSDFKLIPKTTLIIFSIISVVGGTLGALLLLSTDAQTFRLVIPWLLAFATFIFAFSKPIARWAGHKHGEKSLKWTLFVAAVQFVVAIYGGYFGAGIGVLMLAALSFAGLESIHQMNALKVLLATIINGAAMVVFMISSLWIASGPQRLNWPLALAMIPAAIAGGYFGMRFARKVKQDQLRALILLVGIILTVVYFYRAYGPQ